MSALTGNAIAVPGALTMPERYEQTQVLAVAIILFIAAPAIGTLPIIPGGVPTLTSLAAVLLFIAIRRSSSVFRLPSFLATALAFILLGTHTLLWSRSTFANIAEVSLRVAILVPIFLLAGVTLGQQESRVLDRTIGVALTIIGVAIASTIWFSETTFAAHRVAMGRVLASAFIVVALSPLRLGIRLPASAVLFLGLLSSGSRGAFLFGSFAVLTVTLLRAGLSVRKFFAIQIGIFIVIQQLAGTLFDAQETIVTILSSRSGEKSADVAFRQAQSLNLKDMLSSPSSTVRTDETFAPAIDQFWDHPFTGVGMATGVSPRRESYVYAHNFLLESASSVGIFGIVGAFLVIVYLGRYVVLDRNDMPVFAGLAIFAVLTSLVSGNIAINRELWLMLGVAYARLADRSAMPRLTPLASATAAGDEPRLQRWSDRQRLAER